MLTTFCSVLPFLAALFSGRVDWLYVEMTLELELCPQPFIFVRTNYHQRKVFRAVKFFPESLYSERLYGLHGSGIASRWGGRDFPSRPDQPWWSPDVLCNGHQVSFSGVRRPGRGVHHPPPSSAEVKERVGLYLYSPWDLTAFGRANFTFIILWIVHVRTTFAYLIDGSEFSHRWPGPSRI